MINENKLCIDKTLVKLVTKHELLYCGVFQKREDHYEPVVTIPKSVKEKKARSKKVYAIYPSWFQKI